MIGWMGEEDPEELLGNLTLLAPARPFSIELLHATESPRLQADELLREPIMRDCPRLTLYSPVPPMKHKDPLD